ncbi:hypothetical protein RBH88_11640 [Aminobacterium sp. MB27-C1]|nr:hypothetical protein [Aminobacterium sp. MB27-C1]WMI71491.1 hypothetical protein RBH88_11640 [Aminobacterium sp. MB27-C1]
MVTICFGTVAPSLENVGGNNYKMPPKNRIALVIDLGEKCYCSKN